MSITWGRVQTLLKNETVFEHEHGYWNSFVVQGEEKAILFLMFYRILATSSKVPITSHYQLNYVHRLMHPEKKYREKILNKMVEFVHKQKNIDDIIIAGDLNSALHEDEIQRFFTRIGVTDIFSEVNDVCNQNRAPTFIHGKKCIETLAGNEGILQYVQGCKLVNYNEIISTDHLGIMADIDFNGYMNIYTSAFNIREFHTLDPR